MNAKTLIKESYVSPLVAYGLGNVIGYPNILGATALGYGMAEAASTLNKAEAAGQKKDYGEALERGITGGVGGTIGSLLGVLAGLAAVPLLKKRGLPLGVAMLVPLVSGKIGGVTGMKMLTKDKKAQQIILEKTRHNMLIPQRKLKYVPGKGVVKTSSTQEVSNWKKMVPYLAGATAAGVGMAGGYGLTKLLAKAMKKNRLSRGELAAVLGLTIPTSLATGHKAGSWVRDRMRG